MDYCLFLFCLRGPSTWEGYVPNFIFFFSVNLLISQRDLKVHRSNFFDKNFHSSHNSNYIGLDKHLMQSDCLLKIFFPP